MRHETARRIPLRTVAARLTGWPMMAFVAIIFGYYFLATILPIDVIIGRLYPIGHGLRRKRRPCY